MSAEIREGYDVFVHDGEKAFGAVRQVYPHGRMEIVVYVEGAGDLSVPLTAIHSAREGKVVLDCGKLEHKLRRAIGHAHDREDPSI